MEYLDSQGLSQFLSNLYSFINNNNLLEENNEEPNFDYNVFIDNNIMKGNFTLTSFDNDNTLYIVKNV